MHKKSFYEKYIKRLLDVVCALVALGLFWWLYIIIAILVRIKIGSPIVFTQLRPGVIDIKTGKEKIFKMYKFRTMSNECDKSGKLLSDDLRLSGFGIILRQSSLDEILEVFNILKGDMSVIGPRPQLVRDMVFMSDKQRMRHIVKPGLSGLAQVMGRNAISWEDKFNWDLKYIDNVTFINDLKIFIVTIKKIFTKEKKIEEVNLADDYGDVLLKAGKITKKEYDVLQVKAKQIMEESNV